MRRLLLAASCGALPAFALAAPIEGPYVSLGGGVDFQQDESISAVPGVARQRTIHFNLPGAATALSLGWGFGNGLRVEIEGDYFYSSFRKLSAAVPRAVIGNQQQYGGFANVLYDLPVAWPVTPYVGVGVGGQIDQIDNFAYNSPPLPPPRRGGDVNFSGLAYQAIAGLAYDVAPVPGLALTAEYRFVGLADPLPSTAVTFVDLRTDQLIPSREKFGNIFHHSVMFGLRYAFNAAPPAPRALPAPAAAPVPAPARTYLVFFDWDRATLTPRAEAIIGEAARNSTRVATTEIEVDGYTDTSALHPGPRGARYNLALSIRRADAVRGALIRDGVPANVIEAHGYGQTHPLIPTGPDAREPQNRRVEIILR